MPCCVVRTNTAQASPRVGRRSRADPIQFMESIFSSTAPQAYIGHVSRLVAIAVRFCGGPGHTFGPTIALFQTQIITAHW